MKTARKGTNDRIKAKMAEHQRRMESYIAAGQTRAEASRLAFADMTAKPVTAKALFANPKGWMK
jgi:hypothetical protein